jgi:predicted dehydrogenase
MGKIKFAVVGCGHIGKRHAEMIVRNEDAELVALVDIKDKVGLNIGQFNVPFYTCLDDLLKSNLEIDIVNIATPNGFHVSQAVDSLDAKKICGNRKANVFE